MLHEILPVIGLGFSIVLIVQGLGVANTILGKTYQMIVLGGSSIALLHLYTQPTTPTFLLWLGLFLFYSIPFHYFFLVSSQLVKQRTQYLVVGFMFAIVMGTTQSSLYISNGFERFTELNQSVYIIQYLMIVISFWASCLGLILSSLFSYKLLKSNTSTSALNKLAYAVLPIIGITLVCLFNSMLSNNTVLPSQSAMQLFSLTFFITCGYMVYLRFQESWLDIFNFDFNKIEDTNMHNYHTENIQNQFNALTVEQQRSTVQRVAPTTAINQAEEFEKYLVHRMMFSEKGLTISKLAKSIAIPEYKIRHYIIDDLGYNNFNKFLNTHRVNHLKKMLKDSYDSNLPIKTLAYECGFETAETCCRVFKATVGMTPVEYRKSII